MNTEDALVRAILDNPAEDMPRLAYADFLDETPTPKRQARAEFIRLQVEHYRIREACEAEGVVGALAVRENAILRKWGAGWIPPMARRLRAQCGWAVDGVGPRVDGGYGSDVFTFRRGFIAEAFLHAWYLTGWQDFLASKARPLLAANPAERITFRLIGHTPDVTIRVLSWAESGTGWCLGYTPSSYNAAFGPVYPTRAELCRHAPDIITATLEAIHFTAEEVPF